MYTVGSHYTVINVLTTSSPVTCPCNCFLILSAPNLKVLFGTTFRFSIILALRKQRIRVKGGVSPRTALFSLATVVAYGGKRVTGNKLVVHRACPQIVHCSSLEFSISLAQWTGLNFALWHLIRSFCMSWRSISVNKRINIHTWTFILYRILNIF